MSKEEEILLIAEDEFFRNGYLNTSMVTVAKRAGVTHAMVNYYFRSKEQLFLRILDTHTFAFIEKLKPVMKEGSDFIQTLVDAAYVLYDTLADDRVFPLLLHDIARSCPEILDRYREPVETFVKQTIGRHSERLEAEIREGRIAETCMTGVIENLMQLVLPPYIMIPTLQNVCKLSEERINDYLARRRKEIGIIIRSRYSI